MIIKYRCFNNNIQIEKHHKNKQNQEIIMYLKLFKKNLYMMC